LSGVREGIEVREMVLLVAYISAAERVQEAQAPFFGSSVSGGNFLMGRPARFCGGMVIERATLESRIGGGGSGLRRRVKRRARSSFGLCQKSGANHDASREMVWPISVGPNCL
jgi:hypothetical protein